jgi:hypothetical protein
MVQPSYMLHKPVPRSYAKIVFNQQIVPALINAAGGVEALLERLWSGPHFDWTPGVTPRS